MACECDLSHDKHSSGTQEVGEIHWTPFILKDLAHEIRSVVDIDMDILNSDEHN